MLKNVQTYEIIDPKDVGIDDNAIVLTARSGRAALKHRLHVLGVELEQDKLDKVYEDFLKLADKKKDITDDDILVLAGADRSVNNHIKLDYLQVTSGVGVPYEIFRPLIGRQKNQEADNNDSREEFYQ